ncbi:Uncharacterised protein [Yersinia frederiksenii]|nr:Uncharacterised protein [Yersinia frederiksenii]
MSLQHQRISELCADYKLERIASEWPALAKKHWRMQGHIRRLFGTASATGDEQP